MCADQSLCRSARGGVTPTPGSAIRCWHQFIQTDLTVALVSFAGLYTASVHQQPRWCGGEISTMKSNEEENTVPAKRRASRKRLSGVSLAALALGFAAVQTGPVEADGDDHVQHVLLIKHRRHATLRFDEPPRDRGGERRCRPPPGAHCQHQTCHHCHQPTINGELGIMNYDED